MRNKGGRSGEKKQSEVAGRRTASDEGQWVGDESEVRGGNIKRARSAANETREGES